MAGKMAIGMSSRSHHSVGNFLFPGHHVCKVAWMHLLGIGKKRLSRCKKTCYGKDGRSTFGRNLMKYFELGLIDWQLHFDFGLGLKQYYTKHDENRSSSSSNRSGLASKSAHKSASVRAFFVHMYWSAGEPMTTELLVHKV